MAFLEIKNLQKDFSGLKVLFGINVAIEQGERHAIIGPNGAGKSTIFNLITGKYAPSGGKIFFKNQDITGLLPHEIVRLGIARSFQITNIFHNMTVFQNMRNVVLSKRKSHYNIISRVSKMNDIVKETNKLMGLVGLLDKRNEMAGELAHGQQRALEMGLSIAIDPELILLDEPTAGMSKSETIEMVNLIENVTKGKTLIIVEHDMDVIFRVASRITVIYHGQVLASGPPEEIRSDSRVREAYLGTQRK